MKFLLKWIIILGVIIPQCGIPSNELFEDLNTPKNLTWIDSAVTGDGQIIISFTAYNPELTFSGYNIYMHTSSDAELRNQYFLHVQNNIVNADVERNYIVKNKLTLDYPTIQEQDVSSVITARTTPTSITFTITRAPNEQPLAGSYFIGITAYSPSNHIESGLSEVIQVIP
ncbi:MAG: hypothetical protein OEV44_08530 [Spirochaetota bacterium]|nr:hypothetical protein [Spirochaetota bacterium]